MTNNQADERATFARARKAAPPGYALRSIFTCRHTAAHMRNLCGRPSDQIRKVGPFFALYRRDR